MILKDKLHHLFTFSWLSVNEILMVILRKLKLFLTKHMEAISIFEFYSDVSTIKA